MDKWKGKVAVVTGASSGIGANVAIHLAKNGLITIGLARRVERFDELRKKLPEEQRDNLKEYKCDLSVEEDIVSTFKWIGETFGGIDVLINNAGVGYQFRITDENNSDSIRQIVNTNFLSYVFSVREAYKYMKTKDTLCQIVNINSTVCNNVWSFLSLDTNTSNVYAPLKMANHYMKDVLKYDFIQEKAKIRITNINPGVVRTEMVDSDFFNSLPYVLPDDISDLIIFVLSTPNRVEIGEILIKPFGEKF